MSGWLRGDFAIGRGIELWDDTDNAVELTVFDRAGNSDSDAQSPITLDTSASAGYTYDDNGCMTADGTYTYEYDRENRLVCVKLSGSPVVEFAYDALGRRVLKDDGTTVTRFIYDGQNVVEEYEYDDGPDTWDLAGQYLHGIGIDNVLSIERKDGETWPRWYYHHDGLGSVTELTDSNGDLSQAYEYDAWGNATTYVDDHAAENRYLYTGREWDAEIALYYYRVRHYAPTLGRFLQPDPIGRTGGPNLYVYAAGAPTVYTDPTGLTGWRTLWDSDKPLDSGDVIIRSAFVSPYLIRRTWAACSSFEAHSGGPLAGWPTSMWEENAREYKRRLGMIKATLTGGVNKVIENGEEVRRFEEDYPKFSVTAWEEDPFSDWHVMVQQENALSAKSPKVTINDGCDECQAIKAYFTFVISDVNQFPPVNVSYSGPDIAVKGVNLGHFGVSVASTAVTKYLRALATFEVEAALCTNGEIRTSSIVIDQTVWLDIPGWDAEGWRRGARRATGNGYRQTVRKWYFWIEDETMEELR